MGSVWLEMLKSFRGDVGNLKIADDPACYRKYTYLPFPAFIDIHVNFGTRQELFGPSKHDAHFTLQCMHSRRNGWPIMYIVHQSAFEGAVRDHLREQEFQGDSIKVCKLCTV